MKGKDAGFEFSEVLRGEFLAAKAGHAGCSAPCCNGGRVMMGWVCKVRRVEDLLKISEAGGLGFNEIFLMKNKRNRDPLVKRVFGDSQKHLYTC